MVDFAVSPSHLASELQGASLEKRVEVFEAQVRGWCLDHARFLASAANPNAQHAGFAILTLCVVYLEAIACFLAGRTSRREEPDFLKQGLIEVFANNATGEEIDAFVTAFYTNVRCGLYHQGIIRGNVQIARSAAWAMAVGRDSAGSVRIVIDPWHFLSGVERHFAAYLAKLRDPSQTVLRDNFARWFDARAE
jgi:hypothetical protein